MSEVRAESESQPVLAEDLAGLCQLLSRVTGTVVDPAKDVVVLKKPDWKSRNSNNHAIVCDINSMRRVVLKRCFDMPEFLRREVAVSKAKEKLGLPRYGLALVHGLRLRVHPSGETHPLANGWENRTFIVIDYGRIGSMKRLRELTPDDVKDSKGLLYAYGKWCAFNYLLGVRDRKDEHFIFCLDTQELHSIDNEDGPFDTGGGFPGVDDILMTMSQNVRGLIDGPERTSRLDTLRRGFVDCWNQARSRGDLASDFNEREGRLLESLLSKDPDSVAQLLK